MKIAVQMYSVRDKIKDSASLLRALDRVKKIGYDGVEFAGYFDADAKKIKAKLDKGVLKLTLPKKPEVVPTQRQLEIE